MLVNIICPACRIVEISFEPYTLAQGGSFSCNGCGAEISVADQSRDKLQSSVVEYDAYINKLASLKDDGNKPI